MSGSMKERPASRPGQGVAIAPAFMLTPAVLVITLFVALPFGGLLISSFTGAGGPTFENYVSFFDDSFYLGVLLNTALTGALAAVFALVLGYPIAYYLRFGTDRARRYIALAVLSPLLISVVVRSYALTLVIGPRNPIEQIIAQVIPDFHMNLLFSRAGVLIGLVYTLAPFMVLSLVSSLSAIDAKMLSAARSLGAGTWTILRRIVFPLSVPGIVSGCFAVFSLSVTSFVLPMMLGGSGYKMLAQLINQQILVLYNWPFGFAICVILLAFNGVLLYVSAKLVGRMLIPGLALQKQA